MPTLAWPLFVLRVEFRLRSEHDVSGVAIRRLLRSTAGRGDTENAPPELEPPFCEDRHARPRHLGDVELRLDFDTICMIILELPGLAERYFGAPVRPLGNLAYWVQLQLHAVLPIPHVIVSLSNCFDTTAHLLDAFLNAGLPLEELCKDHNGHVVGGLWQCRARCLLWFLMFTFLPMYLIIASLWGASGW